MYILCVLFLLILYLHPKCLPLWLLHVPILIYPEHHWNDIDSPKEHLLVPCSGRRGFIALCFIVLHRYCIFCKKVYGNPASSKSVSTIFPTAYAHLVSNFGNSCKIPKPPPAKKSWLIGGLRWWLAFLSNKVFFN